LSILKKDIFLKTEFLATKIKTKNKNKLISKNEKVIPNLKKEVTLN
jgi:hypothetical protein